MMHRPAGLGPLLAGARTVPRHRILDMLVTMCWPFEAACTGLAQARAAADIELTRLEHAGLQCVPAARGGHQAETQLFDPAEVVNSFRRAALDDPAALYFTRFVPCERRRVLDVRGLSAGTPPPRTRSLPPARVSLSLTRRMNLAPFASLRAARLSLPLPIEDAALTDLEMTISLVCAGGNAEARTRPGRLDIQILPPFGTETIVRADLSFTAHAGPDPMPAAALGADDFALYTRPAEGLIQVTTRVGEAAAAIAGNCRDAGSAILRLWQHLLGHLTCGRVGYGSLPAADAIDAVLETGWTDCHMAACLFAALCRACSIPARVCSGILLHPASPAYHSWAEAWCQERGWQPFDFWVLDLSAGGRDPAWLAYFACWLDYRCKTQTLPRQSAGIVLRKPWHMLLRPLQPGVETTFQDAFSGDLIYADSIVIHDLTP